MLQVGVDLVGEAVGDRGLGHEKDSLNVEIRRPVGRLGNCLRLRDGGGDYVNVVVGLLT